MIILTIISTIIMLIGLYVNRVMSIMLNVTSCTTNKFDELLNDLKDNRQLAMDTREKFNKNYQHRKAILEKIRDIDKE